jgi:diguanylate cyclase (GGDEF)-like protein
MSECRLNFEDQRLAALYSYDVLDTQPEESFDRITRLVRMTLGTPIAVVSLVDRDRQWFKSRQGTDRVETPRSISFCTHTIQTDEPLIIPDALEDPRFRDSPLVTGENGVRMYVGMPLRTPDGFNIGALCAIDTKPGTVSPEQVDVPRDLARLVVDELELRKLATVDSLTGAMTGRSFALESKREVARARDHSDDLGCIMLDIDHFKKVNDTLGHAAGDQVLRSVTTICRDALRPSDVFGRVGGEEFAIMLPQTPIEETLQIAERLRERVAGKSIAYSGGEINVTASLGVTALSPADEDFQATLKRADSALYEAKEGGRNLSVCIAPPPAETVALGLAAALEERRVA